MFGGEYANYVFVENPGSLPGGYLAGVALRVDVVPRRSALIAIVPLLLPGRARARAALAAGALGGCIVVIVLVVGSGWSSPAR